MLQQVIDTGDALITLVHSELREETAREAMEASIAYRRFKEAQA